MKKVISFITLIVCVQSFLLAQTNHLIMLIDRSASYPVQDPKGLQWLINGYFKSKGDIANAATFHTQAVIGPSFIMNYDLVDQSLGKGSQANQKQDGLKAISKTKKAFYNHLKEACQTKPENNQYSRVDKGILASFKKADPTCKNFILVIVSDMLQTCAKKGDCNNLKLSAYKTANEAMLAGKQEAQLHPEKIKAPKNTYVYIHDGSNFASNRDYEKIRAYWTGFLGALGVPADNIVVKDELQFKRRIAPLKEPTGLTVN